MAKAIIKHNSQGFRELWKDDDLLMWDAHLQMGDYDELLQNCHGDVLMLGLGLGTVNAKLDYSRINSVEIVELHSDVIEIIDEEFPKTRIVQGDAKTYRTNQQYDVIWIDIWQGITTKTLPEMYEMISLWKKHLKSGGWIDCFYRRQLQLELDHSQRG
ncbi:MAG: hypothetical protein JXR03_20895 [Cyclobacteriaceae bacterium]